jgi:SWI/SNF-related matrix-associated actin-dependent regulator 1 of chromatin subfamily A
MATATETKNSNGHRAVEIENVGPIERLTVPLPPSGVVVLHGRNGAGKSHALAALDSLVSGRGKLPCRDGARSGMVEGVGARLSIGRSTRRTGEAEVATLEGRFDISQLVNPGLKDAEAADKARIKALIQLSGAKADAAEFSALLPEGVTLGSLVEAAEQSADPVTLAAQIKRALESQARSQEKVAAEKRTEATAIRQNAGGVDDAGPSLKDTEAAIQEALLAEQAVKQRASSVAEQIAAADNARKALAELQATDTQDVAAVEAEITETLRQAETVRRERYALMAQRLEIDRLIHDAESRVKSAGETVRGLEARLDIAERRTRRTTVLANVIAAAPEPVPQADIDAASERLAEAKGRYGLAVQADNARKALAKANTILEAATAAQRRAEQLRNAGKALDDVLSSMVGRVTDALKVAGGQLVVAATGEPFDRLSHGEGWRIALEIAANMVGQGGIVVVPQEAWEGQDPINRAEIAEIARAVGILIVTAECSENAEIAAEVA